ncbi:MAG TPA: hypothetical protein VEI06_08630 [Gemmatimonadaceae bacterium]|nr:hypothetical protein [Gemmatimonadaceae bacterium]
MRLNTLLLIAGLLGIAFGVAFLTAPAQTLALYGVTTDATGIIMTRFCGAAFLQLGLILYLVKDVNEPATQRGILIGATIGSAAGLLVALVAQLQGLVNGMGWTTVAIYALLLAGYGSHVARPRPA